MSRAQAVSVNTLVGTGREEVMQLIETLRKMKPLLEHVKLLKITYSSGSAIITLPKEFWNKSYDIIEVGVDYTIIRIPGSKRLKSGKQVVLPTTLWKGKEGKMPKQALMVVLRKNGGYELIVVV